MLSWPSGNVSGSLETRLVQAGSLLRMQWDLHTAKDLESSPLEGNCVCQVGDDCSDANV